MFRLWHQKGKTQIVKSPAMASATGGGSAGDGGDGGNFNLSPLLRTLAKGAAVTLGGIFSIAMFSSTTISFLSLQKKDKIDPSLPISKKRNASLCEVCREKGFYMCRLCKGNGTIEWSPLYDPVFINPCLCPTCDGHRIQRCLNCLGSGFIQQAKGYVGRICDETEGYSESRETLSDQNYLWFPKYFDRIKLGM